jgi:transposase-like protein
MQRQTFDELFALLSAVPLAGAELARLREWIAGISDPAECLAVIEAAAAARPCPHCGCTHVHRCGTASGLQRRRCLRCRKTFNALTGTPLARLRKRERWLSYIACLLVKHRRGRRDVPPGIAKGLAQPDAPAEKARRRGYPARDQPRARLPAGGTRPQRFDAGFPYRPRSRDGGATTSLFGTCLICRCAAHQRQCSSLCALCRDGRHHPRNGEPACRTTCTGCHSHPKRERLAQPVQELARTLQRCRQSLPGALLGMAAFAGRPAIANTGAMAVRCGTTRLVRRVARA